MMILALPIQKMENIMQQNSVILKPGKDKAIRNHHHWIFSGAIQHLPKNLVDGDILSVQSATGDFLGQAYFNRKSDIVGRMLTFDQTSVNEKIKECLSAALSLRRSLFENTQTTAYRLINGEGDGLPGLVVDVYDKVIVIQISTLGMDKLKKTIVDYLVEYLKPRAIYEKSNLSVCFFRAVL